MIVCEGFPISEKLNIIKQSRKQPFGEGHCTVNINKNKIKNCFFYHEFYYREKPNARHIENGSHFGDTMC